MLLLFIFKFIIVNELEKNINYDELDDDFEDVDEEGGSLNSI
jgi:hypothetical protein